MKFHFEPDLDYQLEAIEAVCDLFRGQEIGGSEFTLTRPSVFQAELQLAESGLGVGNRLTLLDSEVLANLQAIQLRHGLPQSTNLASGDFTVEMETGTGKTYVYLRTIYELNRRYGFTKFIIVVPSIAIKEGVYKSLQITEKHLRTLYAGTPTNYFQYNSSKLGQVRNFVTSAGIQIMVVTVGAINKKDVNNLYKASEKTDDVKPIDLIRETRPVVIVDEPQSVDGGLEGRGREALSAMSPLCTLRYSATHAERHHMVYRLDAVDAYERNLVKRIEVASATVEDAHNQPFVRLLAVTNRNGRISARVELDVQTAGGVRRKQVTVQDGDNLERTTRRSIYANCHIGEIRITQGSQNLELRVPEGEHFLEPGQAWGDIDLPSMRRHLIRRTIHEHLDKEKRLTTHGIKVISLFFVDEVSKYRQYDETGALIKGEYACVFEEEYLRAARRPEYRELFDDVDVTRAVQEIHNGYFSIDKKGGWTNTSENNQTGRDSAERAYNLIMKDKEKLLSFDSPLKFIFSHSALREGWDNPNVFQICALREIQTVRERRQTIGRGLRICVNQHGDRVRGNETNTLTVVATESYEQFAENLQREIEEETGIRFGVVEAHQFASLAVRDPNGEVAPLGFELSESLWQHLRATGYINASGGIQDTLRTALASQSLVLPEEFVEHLDQIAALLKKLAGRLDVKNADDRRSIRPRQAVLHGEEFRALWDRVKQKTTYRVQFNNEQLVTNCIVALNEAPPIMKTRLQWRKADVAIGKSGVEAHEVEGAATIGIDAGVVALPDLLTMLQDRTQLTRRTIYRILSESERLDEFVTNPQQFVEVASEAINRCKRLALVDGIKYQRLGEGAYYAQELFEQEELTGYLKNLMEAKKSIYEHVVFDSGPEAAFADQLEKNSAIKVYTKLPGWFTVPTPLGTYNPDWAILVSQDGDERLYFVVETKSSTYSDDLRDRERGKIACGKAHFKAIADEDSPAQFEVAPDIDVLLSKILQLDTVT